MPQLACQNLSLGYDGKTVLSGLSFEVNAGDFLCIVGENGSGKSTLVKTLLRLKSPLAGRVVRGEGLRGDEIGYLPQQTVVQKDFPASVLEIVRSGCLNRRGLRPFYSRREKLMAEEAMARFGVAALAGECYRELSGGQQQRVLLARALVAAGQLLMLDEPTAELDPKASADTYALLKELNGGGLTIIMVSHDLAASLACASHILHLGGGRPPYFGTAAEYAASETGRVYTALGGGGA